jgi:hypothetical protein
MPHPSEHVRVRPATRHHAPSPGAGARELRGVCGRGAESCSKGTPGGLTAYGEPCTHTCQHILHLQNGAQPRIAQLRQWHSRYRRKAPNHDQAERLPTAHCLLGLELVPGEFVRPAEHALLRIVTVELDWGRGRRLAVRIAVDNLAVRRAHGGGAMTWLRRRLRRARHCAGTLVQLWLVGAIEYARLV